MRMLLVGMRSRCDSHRVIFDRQSLALGIEAKSCHLDDAGIRVAAQHISPDYGKPVVTGAFGSARWIGDMTVWITGEAELVTVRLANGWNFNKHYDLASSDDLEIAPSELAALIAEGSVPDEAVTAWVAGESSALIG